MTYSLSLYQNRINDYIYGKDTGERPGADYRVIAYQQDNALFRGVEGQMAYQFSNGFTSTVLADHVRGKLRGKGGDLARIPADPVGLRSNNNPLRLHLMVRLSFGESNSKTILLITKLKPLAITCWLPP